MKNYKKILLILAMIFIGIPSFVMGSSFITSLIQGKSTEEAIQIIANHLDLSINRIEILEEKLISFNIDKHYESLGMSQDTNIQEITISDFSEQEPDLTILLDSSTNKEEILNLFPDKSNCFVQLTISKNNTLDEFKTMIDEITKETQCVIRILPEDTDAEKIDNSLFFFDK